MKELDLLEPMQAQVTLDGGKRLSLGGFMAVNREKLKALPGEKLAELTKTDELELMYLHLQSMRNFEPLRDRLEIVTTEGRRTGGGTGGSRMRPWPKRMAWRRSTERTPGTSRRTGCPVRFR